MGIERDREVDGHVAFDRGSWYRADSSDKANGQAKEGRYDDSLHNLSVLVC